MVQYCRYCTHCIYGDVIYCDVKKKVINEHIAKQTNKCKDFTFCPIDVFSGKEYMPRKCGRKKEQMKLF